MYRDDTCAVCGESLPPDHFYCREHAAEVDDRLQEIGALLPQVTSDVARLATLVAQTAPETWDYLAEGQPGDPDWPPVPALIVVADAEEIEVDVDADPGFVRARVTVSLAQLLQAVAESLSSAELETLAAAAATATGANATH